MGCLPALPCAFGVVKVSTETGGGNCDGEIGSVIGRIKAAVAGREVAEVEAEVAFAVDRAVCIAEWLMTRLLLLASVAGVRQIRMGLSHSYVPSL